MRSAYAPVIAGLLLGCVHNASTQAPDEAAPAAAPAAEGDAAGDPAEDDAAVGGAPAAEAEEPNEDFEPNVAGMTDAELAQAERAGLVTSLPSSDAGSVAASDGGEAPASPESEGKPEQEPTEAPVAELALPKPLHGKADASCGNDPGVGERLKSFSLPGIEGDKTVTHSTFKGRVLVVNFWGTWCKPCLKELPEFDQIYRRYRKHGMTLLAIATDEDPKAVKDIVTEKKWGAKIAIAGETYAGQYGSAKFPFTFVVDHKGVIQASYRGYKPECMGQLEADIREQLTVRHEAKAKRKKG
jgi:peroxiredoxin